MLHSNVCQPKPKLYSPYNVDVPVFTLGPEFDGWESLNINIFEFICSGIGLGNDDVILVLEMFSKFFISWFQGLAMSAPWSIEFNQN